MLRFSPFSRLYRRPAVVSAVVVGALGLLTCAPVHAQTQIYFNDFDAAQTFNGGVTGGFTGITTTESVQGFAGLGPAGNQFSGNFLHNQATGNPAPSTILTLSNLGSHTSIDIDFLLGVIDSWDGQQAPDLFNVRVDGVTVFSPSFAIASGTSNYTPPSGGDIGNGNQQRGFNGSYNDQAYNMYLEPSLHNIAHTSSTVTIEWFASGAGWQGGTDESFGIENVRVSVRGAAAPEPGTLTLLVPGLLSAGTFLVARKRRRKSA